MDKNSPKTKRSLGREPIAIVGMSCRFPQVANLNEFWKLLVEGKDTIDVISRWDIDKYFNADKSAKNKTHQRHSSLFENLDDFDPLFFNISPAEAAEMTPSQKLILELAWETIENSSVHVSSIEGKKTGVYIGNIWNDFEHLRKHKNAEITLHSAIGQSTNVIANRVSYFLGLTGPSLVVDTGCSTSLVALHLACQGLLDGSVDYAIAGGVNHILDPDQNLLLSKFGGLSAKGKCSTFDEGVDGFVRGEGAGLVLLKRLTDAEQSGDHIYAVIRGSAMNNNGFNENLPATSTEGQLDVLREAYKVSGVDPAEVHYVEAHGTGTKLGDPTECNAIGRFFNTNRERPLAIGSVKTNLGHTEATAGIAGLIKTVLAINNKMLPGNLNFKTPNPEIDFEGLNLKVQKENTSWPGRDTERLKAGVNSFGWGGTNSHLVIEEYEVEERDDFFSHESEQLMLPVSAKSDGALQSYVTAFREILTDSEPAEAAKFIASAAIRKPRFAYGELFFGSDQDEIVRKLNTYLEDHIEEPEVDFSKVVFVFPGQGSQWLGMGRDLYLREPVFKEAIDSCDDAFREFTEWSLLEQIHATEENSRLNEISVIQPMLFAMQVALAKLWMSFGVKPAAVVGHSMGEVASAHVSDGLSLKDAAKIICTRSRLMQTVSGQGGAMAVTELTVSEAETILTSYDGLSIAVNNSPKSTVITGEEGEISQLLNELESKELFGKKVKVDVASHSRQMDPLCDELRRELIALDPGETSIELFSTVRGKKLNGEDLTANYWMDNLRQGVQFASTFENMAREGYNTFIEVSPHPVLATSIDECFEAFGVKGLVSPTLIRNKPEIDIMYGHFAELYRKGLRVDWKTYYRDPELPYFQLPNYPFQRSPHSVTEGTLKAVKPYEYGLIGEELKLAIDSHSYFWKSTIRIDDLDFAIQNLQDQYFHLPISIFIEIVLEAISYVTGKKKTVINELQVTRPIEFRSGSELQLQVRLVELSNSFEVKFLIGGNWEVIGIGKYNLTDPVILPDNLSLENPEIDATEFMSVMNEVGSVSFQNGGTVELIKTDERNTMALIDVPKTITHAVNNYILEPGLIETCINTIYANRVHVWRKNEVDPRIISIDEVFFCETIEDSEQLFVYSTCVNENLDSASFDLIIRKNDGTPCLQIKGVKVKLQTKSGEIPYSYQVGWHSQEIKDFKEPYHELLVLYEEENKIVERLRSYLKAFEISLIFIHIKDHLKWAESISWENVDHLIYFSNSEEYESEFKSDSANLISRMIRSVEREKPFLLSKITFVTRSAIPFENLHINSSQASISGLTKVLANEYPELKVSQIDISVQPSGRQMKLLARLLAKRTKHHLQVAIRSDQTYVSRLEKFSFISYNTPQFQKDQYHLIIGADEYSTTTILWMLQNGVKKLDVLCEPVAIKMVEFQLRSFEREGVDVRLHEYSRKELSTINRVLADHPGKLQIGNLIYFDKSVSESAFRDYTTDEFSRQLKVKVNEVNHILSLAENYNIQSLLLITDESSLLGLKGKAIMASSGTFIEGLAALKVREGQKVSVLSQASSRYPDECTESFETPQFKTALNFAQLHPVLGVGLFKLLPDKAEDRIPSIVNSGFGSVLKKQLAEETEGYEVLDTLREKEMKSERIEAITSFLKILVSGIIKSPIDSIPSRAKFKHLGIDSLMAVQFRNQLQKDLSLELSVRDIWKYPTVEDLSVFLLKLLSGEKENDSESESKSPVLFLDNHSNKNVAQLVCFHDAGGSASLYEDWPELLGEKVGLIRVELPGRRNGGNEEGPTPHVSEVIQSITNELKKEISLPTFFIGHSMGGLFAFEVIHELRKQSFQIPIKLFISSTPQLNSYDRSAFDSRMDDEQLVEQFPYLSQVQTPDTELRNFLRTILRADLRLLDTFEYRKKENLDLDLTCIHGRSDYSVTAEQMLKWKDEIDGSLDFIERDGDHHYLKEDGVFVTSLILDAVNSIVVSSSE